MDTRESIAHKLQQSILNNDEITKEKILEAEEISFKNVPETIITLDNYGFVSSNKKNDNHRELSKEEQEQVSNLANVQLMKWMEMLTNIEYYMNKKFETLKLRTREGIPDSLRGNIWQLFGKVASLRKGNENVFTDLINKLTKEKLLNSNEEGVIIRDLHRTFPKHYLFMNRLGEGQRAWYRVLSVYSHFNKKTGYVQGMGFITALFLTYMDEESSFWWLYSMMINYGWEGFFGKDFPELRKSLYVMLSLLKKFMPKIYNLLRTSGVYPTMYASQWFFTVYACVFDFEKWVRIYDCVWLEGFKVVYRIALALFKINEKIILSNKSFESIMSLFKDFSKNVDDIDKWLEIGFKFSFSRKDIKYYEDKYEAAKWNEDEEIMKQVIF